MTFGTFPFGSTEYAGRNVELTITLNKVEISIEDPGKVIVITVK